MSAELRLYLFRSAGAGDDALVLGVVVIVAVPGIGEAPAFVSGDADRVTGVRVRAGQVVSEMRSVVAKVVRVRSL